MPSPKSRAVPPLSEYEQNRRQFTDEQLAPYDGKWVAFSLDGKRIIAGGADLLELDQRIQDAGEDPENVGLEFIEFNSASWTGGIEFG